MARKQNEYVATEGGRFKKARVVAYGKDLDSIEKKCGGGYTREDVVKYAKNKKAAIHECFPWDDSTAAHLHRLTVAGELIRFVRVYITYKEPNTARQKKRTVAVRKWRSIRDSDGEQVFRSIETIKQTPDYLEQVIERLTCELERIADELKVYEALRHLAPKATALVQSLKRARTNKKAAPSA